MTNKRVAQIDHVEKGVEVTTSEGGVFRGTLVVGGDGVHSAVREQMTLIANKLQPGYFPPGEQDRVPCYYKCSFGIAQGVEDYATGELTNIRAKGWSGISISGPENRVYWFIFQRLPEPRYGKDIPKYTKEDELQFVRAPQSPGDAVAYMCTGERVLGFPDHRQDHLRANLLQKDFFYVNCITRSCL